MNELGKGEREMNGHDIHINHENIKEVIDKALEIALSSPAEAYKLAKEAVGEADKLDLSVLKGHGLYALALSCRSLGKHIEAFEYANQAMKIFKVISNDEMKMKLYLIIGISHFYAGAYHASLHNMYLARGLAVQLKNYRSLCSVLNNIGEIHRKSENYEDALVAYKEAARIAEEHHQYDYLGVIVSNVADVEITLGMYINAKKTLENADTYMEHSKDTVLKLELVYRKGKVALLENRLDQAWELICQAEQQLKNVENKYYVIDALILQYEYHKATNNLDSGLLALDEARQVSEKHESEHQLVRVYELLYKHYEDVGDYKMALESFKRHQYTLQKIEADHLIMKLKMLDVEQMSKQRNDGTSLVEGFVKQEIMQEENRVRSLVESLRTISEAAESLS